jgi:hypothetical protein
LIWGKSSLKLFLRGEYLKLERYEEVVFDYFNKQRLVPYADDRSEGGAIILSSK